MKLDSTVLSNSKPNYLTLTKLYVSHIHILHIDIADKLVCICQSQIQI